MSGDWMMENLFKWVNSVIPIRYLNLFSKNMKSRNIMFILTPYILILDSQLKYDFSILAIVN